MTEQKFSGFPTWADVMRHVRLGLCVWYQAPLDYKPVLIDARLTRGEKVRVRPFGDADPFTADEGHLDRFRRIEL